MKVKLAHDCMVSATKVGVAGEVIDIDDPLQLANLIPPVGPHTPLDPEGCRRLFNQHNASAHQRAARSAPRDSSGSWGKW